MGDVSFFIPGGCLRWGFSRRGWAPINRTLGRCPKRQRILVVPAFLCVHLGFRFAECHQMASCPALGETGVLLTRSPELPASSSQPSVGLSSMPSGLKSQLPLCSPLPRQASWGWRAPEPPQYQSWRCFPRLSQQLPNQQNGGRGPPPAWPGAQKGL